MAPSSVNWSAALRWKVKLAIQLLSPGLVREIVLQLSENRLSPFMNAPAGMIWLYRQKQPIFFKSFETVFAPYSLAILNFLGFWKSLTGH